MFRIAWWPECRHWIFPTAAYLQSKERSPAKDPVCALHSRKDFTRYSSKQETVRQIQKHCAVMVAVEKAWKKFLPARIYQRVSKLPILCIVLNPFRTSMRQWLILEQRRLHECVSPQQGLHLVAKTRPLGPKRGSRWGSWHHRNHRWRRGHRRPR